MKCMVSLRVTAPLYKFCPPPPPPPPPKVTNFLSSPFFNQPKILRSSSKMEVGWWGGRLTPWNACVSYNWQHLLILSQFLWDSSSKLTLTIVIHFLFCDLYECKQNLRNIYLTLHHYFELPRRKPKAIFGLMIGRYL